MTTAPTQTEIGARHHARAVRFFWGFLIGATLVSLIGNIAHAIWHLIPVVAIQIGIAAVPPLLLLAVVHGTALSVRAGASGRVYSWAVSAVAAIGAGAFMLSFRALRDLLIQTGTPPAWAWIFPTIIDTAVAVSTLMLVCARGQTSTPRPHRDLVYRYTNSNEATVGASPDAECKSRGHTLCANQCAGTDLCIQPDPAQTVQGSAHTKAKPVDAESAHVDANLASELIASGVTTQPVETVIAVLAASRDGASINSAAKASGIN
jgi:Protein of unknown function (DUF2637)